MLQTTSKVAIGQSMDGWAALGVYLVVFLVLGWLILTLIVKGVGRLLGRKISFLAAALSVVGLAVAAIFIYPFIPDSVNWTCHSASAEKAPAFILQMTINYSGATLRYGEKRLSGKHVLSDNSDHLQFDEEKTKGVPATLMTVFYPYDSDKGGFRFEFPHGAPWGLPTEGYCQSSEK